MKKGIVTLALLTFLLEGCSASRGTELTSVNPPKVEISRAITTATEIMTPETEGLTLQSGVLTFTILSPVDGSTVTSSPVDVKVISNTETVFTINGDLFVIPAGKESTFLVSLTEGYNDIELVASDYEGDQVEAVLTVIYES